MDRPERRHGYTVCMRVFRVIVPVEDIEEATRFYGTLLAADGERVTSGRHYFDCDGVLLACWDPRADGDRTFPGPNPGPSTSARTNPSKPSANAPSMLAPFPTRRAARSPGNPGENTLFTPAIHGVTPSASSNP